MILETRDLSYHYSDNRNIFHNVSFGVEKGDVLCILGSNGAGKSTLLNCLANLYTPTEGEVYLSGERIKSMSLRSIAKKIGYVPQVHTPAYAYTVHDFAVMGRTPYLGMFQKPSKEDHEKADEILEELGIYHLRNKSYTQISGGERQQVTIARALVQDPELIMLDEPTAHLDYGNQLRVIKMVSRLSERGFAVIMTTHNPDHAILMGKRVAILDRDGKLTLGSVDDILTTERLSEIYQLDIEILYIEKIKRKACIAVL